ncbi:MAG TPA: MBL fold metallo-hydrolase [Dehalococcoidia bacterium]|nr:MBL fold metallo-hydrolase [Dehalococcoidia bacterium]
MTVRITTLSENTAQLGFLGEWGLSILVETDSTRVLLDTGLSTSAVYNADLMGIDFSTIDAIVLSHAHGDHTGGLRDVLRRVRKQVQVIAHPDIWIPKYVVYGEISRYAGIPYMKEDLESLGASFTLTTKPFKISDDIMTTGEVEMTTDYETIDDRLFVKKGNNIVPDPLTDDLAIVVKTTEGLVLITGCAHRGIINTVRHVQKLMGGEYIHTIIGGTHLMVASPERIQNTASELKELRLQRLGVSHCTGFNASAALAKEFSESFFLNNAGSQLTFE